MKNSQFFFLVVLFIEYASCRLNDSTLPCFQGPNYWCLNETTEYLCDFHNKTIGLCGYTNKRCQMKTGDEFCKSIPPMQQQSPFQFNGGLTGVEEDYFSYYILSLYWPPSSCPLIFNETQDLLRYFCSPYTDRNQIGRERLVLHGLWPTFATDGNYQGWPQFCSTKTRDWSKCHIDGNLCPWKNTSSSSFTQGNYELCLSKENIQECLINSLDVLQPFEERLKIFAPGYLNKHHLFINHEWTKHGSCCSSTFENNISNYVNHMLDLVDTVTRPGSLTYEYIQRYAGEKLGRQYLEQRLNQTAIINCNSKCELEELWLCLGRDEHTGLPNKIIQCPFGAQNTSNSCEKFRCEYVSIPIQNNRFESILTNFCFLLLILFFLKIFFVLLVFIRHRTCLNGNK